MICQYKPDLSADAPLPPLRPPNFDAYPCDCDCYRAKPGHCPRLLLRGLAVVAAAAEPRGDRQCLNHLGTPHRSHPQPRYPASGNFARSTGHCPGATPLSTSEAADPAAATSDVCDQPTARGRGASTTASSPPAPTTVYIKRKAVGWP